MKATSLVTGVLVDAQNNFLSFFIPIFLSLFFYSLIIFPPPFSSIFKDHFSYHFLLLSD